MHRLGFAIMLISYAHHSEGKLPDFINPCHLSEPKLGNCIRERAKEALPHIIKGVPELDIPPLTKLKIPILNTSPNESITLTFDGHLEGLADIGYKYVTYNRTVHRGTAQMFFPNLKLTGKYSMNGTISDDEVIGEGDATIIFFAPHYDYEYVLGKLEKDGSIYFNVGELGLIAYKAEGATYEFGDLSGGDEENGSKVNESLNANWEVLHNVLGRILAQNVLRIVSDVANKFLESAPVNEIFLP